MRYRRRERGDSNNMNPTKVSDIFNALSDNASVELFKLVALANGNNSSSDVLRSKTNLTRKQYYSRLYRLTHCGLIKRREKRYFLTAFGRIVFNAQTTVDNAIDSYWKIRAIDSLGDVTSCIPAEEQKRLVETLIPDHAIKNILAK